MRNLAWIVGVGTVIGVACGPVVPVDEGGTDGSGSEGTTSTSPSTSGSMPNPTSSPSTSSTTSQGSFDDDGTSEVGSEVGCGFLCEPDWGGGGFDCDPWEEDCPKGEKCMPWANDGGASWNATKCVPIDADPDQVGEPCTVEGNGVSGIDSCEIHSMCWDVDPDTLQGTCVAFCAGTVNNPSCTDACSTCHISGEGVLNLCLPGCDPLAQDCPEGMACYLRNLAFACAPDVSGDGGGVGEPCEYLNACDAGLQCIASDYVPGCESVGCCTPFCEIGNPVACDAIPGTTCEPHGLQDPGCFGEGVGVCVVP